MNEKVMVAFLGDIYLGEQPYLSAAPEIRQILKSADLVIANQEGAITDHNQPIGGKCCLKSTPETANILRSWGVGILSLANNHMFDYGWEGFEQTRRELDEAGIRYLGADEDLGKASRPLIVDVKGIRVGLLAYSWEFVQTTCASEDSYGCAPLDKELMNKQVREVKSQVDVVIVLPHWGYCGYSIPIPEQVGMARSLIDAGATAVAGSHSHVVQGVMEEKGRLTAFSLGNFAFSDYQYGYHRIKPQKENLNGAILKLVLKSNEVNSYELIHTKQENTVIVRDNSERRRKEFERRQRVLAAADYPKYWRRYVRLRLLKRVLYWANIMNWRYMCKGTLVGAFLMFREFFRPTTRK